MWVGFGFCMGVKYLYIEVFMCRNNYGFRELSWIEGSFYYRFLGFFIRVFISLDLGW